MGTFPLNELPQVPWKKLKGHKDTYFGAPRKAGFPIHGACDLMAPAGTAVLAVEDGVIIRGPYAFLPLEASTTYAIDVRHDSFIARYGEIDGRLVGGLKAGDE